MKRLVSTAFIIGIMSVSASAITPSGGLDLTSKYIWRGTECATGPTLFPSGTLEMGDFSIGAWGAYAFDSSVRELDLTLGYTLGDFSFGITDYFYPTISDGDDYFNWKNDETGHLLEGTVSYSPESCPITLLWSTMFYGDDKNPDGKQAFSSYFEASYDYDLGDDSALSAAVGASVLKGFYTAYETGFSVINLALTYSKTLDFGGASLPLSVSYVVNPQLKKSFLSATMGISF